MMAIYLKVIGKKGKDEGKVIYYYNDGERYENDYKNGNKEGKGIFYYNDGQICEGDWKKIKEMEKVQYTIKIGIEKQVIFLMVIPQESMYYLKIMEKLKQ